MKGMHRCALEARRDGNIGGWARTCVRACKCVRAHVRVFSFLNRDMIFGKPHT